MSEAEIGVREVEGVTLALLDAWEGADTAVLVDAVASGATPGRVHRVEASLRALPAHLRASSSTHAVGVAETIELARALGRLPAQVVLYGVEGASFDPGMGLSQAVAAVLPRLVETVLGEAWAPAGCAGDRARSAAATAAWP